MLERLFQALEERNPTDPACNFPGGAATYGELVQWSDGIALHLAALGFSPGTFVGIGCARPNGWTVACILACLKAGLGYFPLSQEHPTERLRQMAADAGCPLVLLPTGGPDNLPFPTVGPMTVQSWGTTPCPPFPPDVQVDQRPAYCLFTSGSTGRPKGVCISRFNLDRFLCWAVPLLSDGAAVLLNQAPLTFDLSVLPLYAALLCGGVFWQLPPASRPGDLLQSLAQSQGEVWVSTPSAVEFCLALPGGGPVFSTGKPRLPGGGPVFSAGKPCLPGEEPRLPPWSQALLPHLRRFFFCGEELRASLVERLWQRFPNAEVLNSYGPTETTVAVCAVPIQRDMIGVGPLPVGRMQPAMTVQIDQQTGEITLLGDTVGSGYFDPEQTARSFFQTTGPDRSVKRGYRTGDRGHLADGLLYWDGRIDRQFKYRGYRIEPEEIERLLTAIPGICAAAVVQTAADVPRLCAFCQCTKPLTRRQVRGLLAEHLPPYLLPAHIYFLDRLPLTDHDKIDYKRLEVYCDGAH